MYAFDLDTGRRFLRITLTGFWDEPLFDEYAPRLTAAMRRLKALPGPTACLVDVLGMSIQSQAVAERQQALLAELRPYHADRVALLTPGALSGMQASRVGSPVDHRVFATELEATAWLFPAEETGAEVGR